MNLIDRPELQDTIRSLANDLYDWLETTGGMQIPLKRSVYYRTAIIAMRKLIKFVF